MLKNITIIVLLLLNIGLIAHLASARADGYAEGDIVSKRLAYDYREIIRHDSQRTLPDSIKIADSEDRILPADSVLRGKTLVIRYSSLNCNSCVDTIMHYAKMYADSVADGKICVLASYQNDRDFHLMSRLNKSKVRICQVKDELLALDRKEIPYMFVANSDKTISHLYIPHKELPGMISWYYSIVVPYIND